MRMRTQEM